MGDLGLKDAPDDDEEYWDGRLGAVNGPPRKQGGQLRDGESVQLVLEDVVYPLLAVGDLFLKRLVEPLGDFTQEDAGFAAGI